MMRIYTFKFAARSFRAFAIPAALSFTAGCMTSPTPVTGAPEDHIDVIAHRGASADRPENTLAAFAHAIDSGAHWFELDCRITADGEVVVIHDATLQRTTDGEGRIVDTDLATLRTLDAGSWFDEAYAGEKIPTLDEALALADGRIGVYVEIKSADDDEFLINRLERAASVREKIRGTEREGFVADYEASGSRNVPLTRRAIAAIRKANMRHEVVIQSFNPMICLLALHEAPGIRTEFLGAQDPDHPDRFAVWQDVGHYIRAHGFNVHYASVNAERVDAWHAAGKSVAVWTVDEPDVMRHVAGYGVDAIISNKPALALETLAAIRPAPPEPDRWHTE